MRNSYKLALDISIYREVYFLKIYSRINLLFKITIFTINWFDKLI